MSITHFSPDTLTAEHKTYCTDFIRYHVHYSESHCPDRLRRLVNEGSIISYLDDLEAKVNDALNRQVQLWKDSDREYQTAVAIDDTNKQNGLENCFSIWQENLCLSVWFILDLLKQLCLNGAAACLLSVTYHFINFYFFFIFIQFIDILINVCFVLQ